MLNLIENKIENADEIRNSKTKILRIFISFSLVRLHTLRILTHLIIWYLLEVRVCVLSQSFAFENAHAGDKQQRRREENKKWAKQYHSHYSQFRKRNGDNHDII